MSGQWNRSNAANQPVEKKGGVKSPSVMKGVIVGAVAVVVGVVCIFLFSGKGEKPVEKGDKDRGRIKEVAPAVPATPVETNEVKKIDPNARPTRVGEVVNGYVMLPSGRIHRRVGVITNSAAMRPQPPYKIFKRRCNNEIACYLSLKPGQTIVGPRTNAGRFTKDFLDSISEPIVITKDDTPEQAQLKKDVIAARLQLKEAYDRGEDLEQIMEDTRKEIQDLGRARNAIRSLLNSESRKCTSEAELDDLIGACNKMLEEKGIAPLECSDMARKNLWRNIQEDQAEAAAEAAAKGESKQQGE